jgi:type I restriction enzyme, S subunit
VNTVEFGSLFHFIRNGMSIKQDKSGEGLPITRIETIANAQIDSLRVGYAGLKENDCLDWIMEPGDILFSHINSVEHIGKCAVYHGAPEKLVHGMNLLCLRCDNSILFPEFAKYLIRSPAFRSRLSNFINKAVNQASVSIGNLKTIPVSVPPLEEQKRIADILDRAEAFRAKRRAALAQIDEFTQSIFIDMFGNPATNPKKWPLKPLGELSSKFSDGPFGSNIKSSHYRENGIRVVRLQNIGVGEFMDNDKAYVSEEHFTELKKHECLPGDVLIGTLGNPNLRACIQPEWLNVALNKADCVQFRPDKRIVNAPYICFLLNQPATEKMAQDLILGQTRLRISMGRLRGLEVPLPPLSLQQEFASRILAVEKLKEIYKDSMTDLDELFTSLQYRAFRGEL